MVNWKHKLLLNTWALSTLCGSISLVAYLLGSVTFTRIAAINLQTNLMDFSRNPLVLSIVFGVMTAISLAITIGVRNNPLFQGSLRKVMTSGTVTAVIGLSLYGLYVGPLSTMNRAEGVPQVGEQAPDFEITDPTGRTWRLSDFRSDVLVVFYRAFW